ncbi:MAG: hypothetical protein E6J42_10920 [Chloroflexi bacterium]|nr:MAG: hypothetical protein E6J42_10920 [Chloroflexota bacterium]
MKVAMQGDLGKVKATILNLDLDPIKIKLMDPEEGKGWTREEADRAEVQYKRFLYLSVKYPQAIVPHKIVDAMWHAHILDTRKYAEDCEKTFGFFLHHFPYFGMRGPNDAADLEKAFEETCRLYQAEFGDLYVDTGISGRTCDSCGGDSCGSSCGWPGQKCSGDKTIVNFRHRA